MVLQEIITYILIGSAVTIAILKIKKKLGGKKKTQKVDYKNKSFIMEHNCSDCSADCMLRDAVPTVIQNNKDLCEKIEIKSNDL